MAYQFGLLVFDKIAQFMTLILWSIRMRVQYLVYPSDFFLYIERQLDDNIFNGISFGLYNFESAKKESKRLATTLIAKKIIVNEFSNDKNNIR